MTSHWYIPSCEIISTSGAVSINKLHEANLIVEKCPDQNEPELVLRILNKNNPNQSVSSVIAKSTLTDVDLIWLSDRKLQITHPQSLKLFQKPTSLENIELVFLEKD